MKVESNFSRTNRAQTSPLHEQDLGVAWNHCGLPYVAWGGTPTLKQQQLERDVCCEQALMATRELGIPLDRHKSLLIPDLSFLERDNTPLGGGVEKPLVHTPPPIYHYQGFF